MKIIEVSKEKLNSLYIAEVLKGSEIKEVIDKAYAVRHDNKCYIYLDYSETRRGSKYIIESFIMKERIFRYDAIIYIAGLNERNRKEFKSICSLMLNKGKVIKFVRGVE